MAYGNSGLGAAIPSAAPARESVIPAQMAALEKHSDHLHQTIQELEARIGAVLTQEPPQTNKDPLHAPPPGVPLGASLADMNTRIVHATMRLRGIIDRIEL